MLRRAHGALNFLLEGDLGVASDPCGVVGDEGAIESAASRCFKLMLGGIAFVYKPVTCYEDESRPIGRMGMQELEEGNDC